MMFNPNLDLLSIMISTVPLAGISTQRRNALCIYCQGLLLPTFQSSQLLLSAMISLTEGSDDIDQICV